MAAALIFNAALLFGIGGTPEAVLQGDITVPCMGIDERPTVIEIVDIPEPAESTVGMNPPSRSRATQKHRMYRCPITPERRRGKFSRYRSSHSKRLSHPEVIQIESGIKGAIDGDLDGVFRKGGPITSGMLDSSPRAIVQTAPLYPGEAQIHGIEDRVLLGFTVDETGRVVHFRMAVPIIFSLND